MVFSRRILSADMRPTASSPVCGDYAAVLATVKDAARRLRRCPSGILDRRCARRLREAQVGTTGWSPVEQQDGSCAYSALTAGGQIEKRYG
jgi:hypothetical protein